MLLMKYNGSFKYPNNNFSEIFASNVKRNLPSCHLTIIAETVLTKKDIKKEIIQKWNIFYIKYLSKKLITLGVSIFVLVK